MRDMVIKIFEKNMKTLALIKHIIYLWQDFLVGNKINRENKTYLGLI